MKKKIANWVVVTIAVCFCSIAANAQRAVTKYYDSLWRETAKENAFYYCEFVKKDSLVQRTSYWVRSGKMHGRSQFADSSLNSITGVALSYYENGRLQDSSFYDKGKLLYQNDYNEDGRLNYHVFYDKATDSWLGENYDNAGNKTPGFFTYQVQAKFPGGQSAWIQYLMDNLRTKVPTRHGAGPGLYTVVVSFLVDKEGKVTEVKAENDPGYGTAEEAVRVVTKSPAWIPAEQNNKKVIYRQRQSITFQVERE